LDHAKVAVLKDGQGYYFSPPADAKEFAQLREVCKPDLLAEGAYASGL